MQNRDYTKDIEELRRFFNYIGVSSKPIWLNKWTRLNNPRDMIRSHLNAVIEHNGKEVCEPYLNRLYELKIHLEKVK